MKMLVTLSSFENSFILPVFLPEKDFKIPHCRLEYIAINSYQLPL